MCGRQVLRESAAELVNLFAAVPANNLPETPDFNICPTDPVHTVTTRDGVRHLAPMRWGFLPHWYKTPTDGPLLINARAETIAEKPAFRAACRERRCIIPASGYYEWSKDEAGNRLPWYIHAQSGAPLAMAGIWQSWGQGDEQLNTCAVVTTASNEATGHVHHRMPVMLAPDDWALWLGEAGKGAARLMTPAPEDMLDVYRVHPRVNSNRAEGPELIEPWDEDEDGDAV